jgi:hypothetical protein
MGLAKSAFAEKVASDALAEKKQLKEREKQWKTK